jgi:hypothetical protein
MVYHISERRIKGDKQNAAYKAGAASIGHRGAAVFTKDGIPYES